MNKLDELRKLNNPVAVVKTWNAVDVMALAREMNVANPQERFGTVEAMREWVESNLDMYLVPVVKSEPWPSSEAWPTAEPSATTPLDVPPLPTDVPPQVTEPAFDSAWDKNIDHLVESFGAFGAPLRWLMTRVSPEEVVRSGKAAFGVGVAFAGKSWIDAVQPGEKGRLTREELWYATKAAGVTFGGLLLLGFLSKDAPNTPVETVPAVQSSKQEKGTEELPPRKLV